MHTVEVLSGVVGLLLGCLLGMWLAKRKQPDYEALQAEHDAYRNDVETHFEKTAQLAHQMAEDYRNMYQHLAQGAVDLCEQGNDSTAPSLVAMRRHLEKKSESADGPDIVPGQAPIKPTDDA
ncbi:MAG: DUF1043 family protein [Gammaproteobacteria bacterium]|nr:DUF1043 family protein [Gammaproteobacteria bacterium]